MWLYEETGNFAFFPWPKKANKIFWCTWTLQFLQKHQYLTFELVLLELISLEFWDPEVLDPDVARLDWDP